MLEAERRADPPDAVVAEMDRRVIDYLRGTQPLESAVDACIRALGPRPVVKITMPRADATVRARLQTLQDALAALSQGTG